MKQVQGMLLSDPLASFIT